MDLSLTGLCPLPSGCWNWKSQAGVQNVHRDWLVIIRALDRQILLRPGQEREEGVQTQYLCTLYTVHSHQHWRKETDGAPSPTSVLFPVQKAQLSSKLSWVRPVTKLTESRLSGRLSMKCEEWDKILKIIISRKCLGLWPDMLMLWWRERKEGLF